MKRLPQLLLLGITVATLTASESALPIRDVLHQEFRYTASLRAPADDNVATPLAASDEPVLRLEQMTIVESAMQRDLARDVRRHWERDTERQFSWQKGGLIGTKVIGAMMADYGVWPNFFYGFDDGGRHLVRQGPVNIAEVKIEFLRIRW